jgi:hypothetical protein
MRTGSDEARCRVGAAAETPPFRLFAAMSWDLPWALTLNSGFTGTGGSTTVNNAATSTPVFVGGPQANDVLPDSSIDAFMSDSAADEALRADRIKFVEALPEHKAKAPGSYWKMVGALGRSPISFDVQITVDKGENLLGDDITVVATAHNSVSKTR